VSCSFRPTDPPSAEEIEVSLFGPGFGESVLIHLGNEEWLAVDSCMDPEHKVPVALRYFDEISVDPAKSLKCIVASHWDNDHIKGIGELFRCSDSAKFHCTAAFEEKSFLACLSHWITPGFVDESGTEELIEVLQELKKRQPRHHYVVPEFASANKILWEKNLDVPYIQVRALAPSSAGIFAMVASLKKKILDAESFEVRRRLPRIVDNHASVVLRIQIGETAVLLGGDIQMRQDSSFGWKAILEEFGQKYMSNAYKVPHHGSSNADDDVIWIKLLSEDPPALIAPYVGGGHNLPTLEDCRRLQGRTDHAYITALPLAKRYRDPNPAVDRTMREATRSIREISGRFGHIRIRKNIDSNGEWDIKTFGDGMSLDQCIQALENNQAG